MKKNFNKTCLLLSIVALFGCSNNPQVNILRRTFENGKNYEVINESINSDKKIYYTNVIAMPEEEKDYEVEAKDFEAVVDGNKHKCLYFINEMASKSIKMNDQYTRVAYIVSTKDIEKVSHGNTASTMLCAFDVDLTENFTLSYKGNTLNFLK